MQGHNSLYVSALQSRVYLESRMASDDSSYQSLIFSMKRCCERPHGRQHLSDRRFYSDGGRGLRTVPKMTIWKTWASRQVNCGDGQN